MYIFRFNVLETAWSKKNIAWVNYQAMRREKEIEAEKKANAEKIEAEKLRARKDENLQSGDGVASGALKAKLRRGRSVFFVADVFIFHVVLRQVLC